jgi:hypothetical protein
VEFINVRGTNGSGKTTLLRQLVKTELNDRSLSSVAIDPALGHPSIPFTVLRSSRLAILGDYLPAEPGAKQQTTAGCDRIKTQAATKQGLERALAGLGVDIVLFEGVVVSTIYGPWKEWADANGGMLWAFLDTPLATCLSRIQERNGGKPVKEDQVSDKHRTIARVRDKALADGLAVLDLPWECALSTLRNRIAEMRS